MNRALLHRLLLSGGVASLLVYPGTIAAQEGAPPGIEPANPPVELPDPRDPVLTREQEPGLPQPAGELPGTDAVVVDTVGEERAIDFEANEIAYDSNADTVTAVGSVLLSSDDRSVRASQVVWDRRSGQIVATGNVRFVDEEGNQLYTDRIGLTEEFETGAMDDLLLALREGGRLAARGGARRDDGSIELSDAAYSACAVVDPEGCDKDPSWRITADRVVYDPTDNRVRFTGAYLELFGARLLPLPGLALRTDGKPVSGFLIPDLRVSESNGLEISGSYYWNLAPNRDVTASAYLFTDAPPMVSAQFRHLTDRGAYQITGYATHSRRIRRFSGIPTTASDLRGYVFANGRYQFDQQWSLTGSVRAVTDRTFLRRYDISREDRLRSTINLERISNTSYFSVAGWATQTLQLGAPQGQEPLVVPLIDYRKRIDDPTGLGATIELQGNTMSLFRDQGQDTQRAFAKGQWDLRRVTGLGQVVTLTGLVRGDVYHSDENAFTATEIYRGEPGWQARGIALAALDLQWPLVGQALGGTQIITPRVQVVATPPIRNLAVPNEDARAIDLEDSNLFALNRFPGYDRVEDGARVTYGLDWSLQRPGWRVKSTIGQSYRLDKDANILVDGTGLSERVSDVVGRTEVRFKDFVKLTHRYRLDKDSLELRRNEFDATVGSRKTYAEIGYLRLNRDIDAGIEDLQDREELRFATRVAFARYWSLFGSGVINLTDAEEDPVFNSDGFQPVRTRLGFAYQDDCLELGLTWRRDYITAGDAQRGDTFQLYFALRNLGFR
ncbi:MAG: LPS assembly protein LptD [Pontixanthobacter sp.]